MTESQGQNEPPSLLQAHYEQLWQCKGIADAREVPLKFYARVYCRLIAAWHDMDRVPGREGMPETPIIFLTNIPPPSFCHRRVSNLNLRGPCRTCLTSSVQVSQSWRMIWKIRNATPMPMAYVGRSRLLQRRRPCRHRWRRGQQRVSCRRPCPLHPLHH